VERQLTKLFKKLLSSDLSDKGLISKIYKELKQIIGYQTNSLVKME
jgi:hypothetical protein